MSRRRVLSRLARRRARFRDWRYPGEAEEPRHFWAFDRRDFFLACACYSAVALLFLFGLWLLRVI